MIERITAHLLVARQLSLLPSRAPVPPAPLCTPFPFTQARADANVRKRADTHNGQAFSVFQESQRPHNWAARTSGLSDADSPADEPRQKVRPSWFERSAPPAEVRWPAHKKLTPS